MLNYKLLFLPVCVLLLVSQVAIAQESSQGLDLIRTMFVSSRKVKSLSYTMVKKERIKGQIIRQQSKVKLMLNPLLVYIYQEEPKSGLEVLFNEAKYGDKCVIHPNGFPWITLYFSPLHPRVLSNQHHNLYKSGFEYVVGILQHLTQKYAEKLNELITLKSEVTWQGKKAYLIVLDNPNFKEITYKVNAGEDAWQIARSYHIGEYVLLDRNPDLSFYTPLPEGKSVLITNDYARRMEITILKESMLPVHFKVYDEKGLYEEYQYHNLLVNPAFSEEDFLKTNQLYRF